jgi:hypothetical protein
VFFCGGALSNSPEPSSVNAAVDDIDLVDILRLLIALDVAYRQPFAGSLLDARMSQPIDHAKRASHACTMLRNPRVPPTSGTSVPTGALRHRLWPNLSCSLSGEGERSSFVSVAKGGSA